MSLKIEKLMVKVEGIEVLRGVDLEIGRGEVVALMGPNGSGKSSLAMALAGHPKYELVKNKGMRIVLDGKSLVDMSVDERARLGLFLALQYPVGIAGVKLRELLLVALRERGEKVSALNLKKKIEKEAGGMGMDKSLLSRGVNDGFSGGEKKKMEILQMKILAPKYAIMDETDSGLDIDALKLVAKNAMVMAKKENTGVLVITHYQRLLKYLRPDRVLVMKQGKIVKRGGEKLVGELEKKGYRNF